MSNEPQWLGQNDVSISLPIHDASRQNHQCCKDIADKHDLVLKHSYPKQDQTCQERQHHCVNAHKQTIKVRGPTLKKHEHSLVLFIRLLINTNVMRALHEIFPDQYV